MSSSVLSLGGFSRHSLTVSATFTDCNQHTLLSLGGFSRHSLKVSATFTNCNQHTPYHTLSICLATVCHTQLNQHVSPSTGSFSYPLFITLMLTKCLWRGYTKTALTTTAPKILMPKNCPRRPIALSKTAHHTTETAHSKVQNGPLSLSAFANIQSDLEILNVEASYTWVRGLHDSETVKCSAVHYGVTCSKFKIVNGSTVCKIATQHFPHKSHTNLIMNPTYD